MCGTSAYYLTAIILNGGPLVDVCSESYISDVQKLTY